MSMHDRRCWWLGLVVIGILATSVYAGERTTPDRDDEIVRLETLLEAQQQRIDALQQQVSANAQDDEDQRTEAMKQQIREVLGEQGFRESLMPSMMQAGYDQGFFIRSSDDKFLMTIGGRVQFRWMHYDRQSRNQYRLPRTEVDDQTGFNLNRVRLTFKGHAYTPDLTYFMKFRADAATGYDLRPFYIWVNYRLRDEFQIKAGLFQLAGTRAGFNSSANMQFVEYPVVEAVFGIGTGVGVRFWGQAFDKRVEYFLDIVNSLNGAGNRAITTDPAELDGNPAFAFRAVWHACGDVPTRDFVSWADIEHKTMPCLDIGFHYAFTDNYGDAAVSRIVFKHPNPLGGGFGVTSSDGVQINQFGLDAAFKWQGFSASGEYICRLLDIRRAGRTPFTPLWLLTTEDSTVAQHGAYVQFGYFLPIPGLEKKLEAVARVGGISVNTEGSEGTWIYAGGLNYYFEGNKVKLQTDVTKIPQVPLAANSWLGNANDNALIWRVQLQVAF